MNIQTSVSALGALAQETRLQIFRLLVQAGESGVSVGKIAEHLDTEANGRLTFHLKELVNSGLASSRQSGRFIYYSANYSAMNELIAYLTEHCCGGAPCGEATVFCEPKPQSKRTSKN
jgi:ArsR family transcriptional regulator